MDPEANRRPTPDPAGPQPATTPPRAAFVLAFAGVVLAGVLGGLIGYGLVDVDCGGGCGARSAVGAVVGAVAVAVGAGIVAVLVLRAMSEWKRHRPE
ncbi:MAG: hypothetical protein U0V73_08120 [Acidimicrobiia bacterium]